MKLCTRFFLLALLLSLCLTLPLAAEDSRILVGDPLESGALILSPAEDGWLYGASPEMDGSADGVAQWFSPADGSVVLTGLQPEGVYQLYRKQADPDGEGQVSPPEALLLFAAPVAPPAAEDFRRLAESTPPYRDKIEVLTTNPSYSYQLTPASDLPDEDENAWQSGGDALVFSSLDPQLAYRLWVRPFSFNGDAYCVPTAVDIGRLSDIVPAGCVETGIGPEGDGVLNIADTEPGLFYTVLAPSGPEAVTGVPAAPVQEGGGDPLVFNGLLPGGRYFPIALEEPPENDSVLPARNAAAQLPLFDDGGLALVWGREEGKLTLTLSPAFGGACYALCTEDGVPLAGIAAFDGQGNALVSADGWFQPQDGLLRFCNLPEDGQPLTLFSCTTDRTVVSHTGCPLALPQLDALPGEAAILLEGNALTLPAGDGVQYVLLCAADGQEVSSRREEGKVLFEGLAFETAYSLYARLNGILPVQLYSFTTATEPSVSPDPEPAPQPNKPYTPPASDKEDDVKLDDLPEENVQETPPTPAPVDGVADVLVCDVRIAYLWGDPQGLCLPDKPMTRAEAAAVFYRLLRQRPAEAASAFSDVPDNAWYAQPVNALAELGIVQGVGGGLYLPEQPITRGEFALLASRFCRNVSVQASFSDMHAGDAVWDAAAAMCHYGLMEPDAQGAFRPGGDIARAEAVRIVNRMLGREPDEQALDGESQRFADLPTGSADYYDIMEAAGGELPAAHSPPAD